MTTITEPTTVRHNVGTCPACKCGLYAEVELVTEIHPPRLDQDGKPQPCTHARIISSRVEHRCWRDDGGEWTWRENVSEQALAADSAAEQPSPGPGDEDDVESGRCCPHCRQFLTDHNRAVWEAGYAVGQRHARQSPETGLEQPNTPSGMSVDLDEDGRAL